jgi:superfamily II DNA helicase RecQ
VPAYVVFSDKTLQAIVSARPATLAALRRVDGIGPTKLELYGEDVLALVAAAGSDSPSRARAALKGPEL